MCRDRPQPFHLTERLLLQRVPRAAADPASIRSSRIPPMDFLLRATRGSMRASCRAICLRTARCSLPSRSDRRGDLSSARRDRDPPRVHDGGRKEEMKHPPTTVMAGDQPKSKATRKKRRRKFAWKILGFAACSKECGGGI